MFSQVTKSHASVQAAIAALEAQGEALRQQGLEPASVQSHRPGKYRLMWRDGDRIRSQTIPVDRVGEYRAAHDRWIEQQRLQRQIKRLERWLDDFAQDQTA